jgi:diguanylate cyclase (GGDEF)-like protein
MHRKILQANFFWPSVVVGVGAVCLLLIVDLAIVRRFDQTAREREQAVVVNGLGQRAQEVAKLALPQVVWDDAVAHLDNRYDPAWTAQNIGAYLATVDGFDATFVLDRDDRPLFASLKGKPASLDAYQAYARTAADLARDVRVKEARRGPLKPPREKGAMVTKPIQATTFAHVGEATYIVTATLVQPDFGVAMPSHARAPIVVTGMNLDEAFLDSFSSRFLLGNLHLHDSDTRFEDDEAHAPLRDNRGAYIATLDWTPQHPGDALLRSLAPPALIIISCLAALALLLYRISRRMAEGLIASEARASHLAYHDALTGLPNRVMYADRLAHALTHARRTEAPVAVFCIDLDRFKEVNDTFGHHAGDELIEQAARRMAAVCRSADTLARLSGDEFAVVQPQATAAGAAALAARLIAVMSEPFTLGVGQVFVGCSVGVSLVKDFDLEPAEAMRQADLALYRAKQNARGQYCFFEVEMDAAIKTRRALEADLRQALADGDLEMAYQAQVNGRGVMCGVEALVRWRHPERGFISPAFFVPIAEECGLIVDLGFFTLEQAFRDSHRWPGLKIAVNVSANQIRTRDFVPRLTDLAARHKVDPRQFELEITEGILLGDDLETHETLKRLRALGFSLALDDFGTGYSSLSYLQRFPITKIKIDRSFIANLGVDEESDAVVAAIVKLARALNLNVIAEGVETTDQRQRLAAAGCSEVQGFLFSKPSPAEEIDRLHGDRLARLQPLAA